MLWWQSNSGSLNLWYDDPSADAGQWVQVNGAGIPEAPVDGKPYLRQNNGWLEGYSKSTGDAALAGKVSKTGDRMTGALVIGPALAGAAPYTTSAIIDRVSALQYGQNCYLDTAGTNWYRMSAGYCGVTYMDAATGATTWLVSTASGAAGVVNTAWASALVLDKTGNVTSQNAVFAKNGFYSDTTLGQNPDGYAFTAQGFSGTAPYSTGVLSANPNWIGAMYLRSVHYSGQWAGWRFAVGSSPFDFMSTGAAAKPGGGSWVDNSDARVKDNIADYPAGLAEVLALQPRTYTYKAETGRDPEKQYIGLVAQEAEIAMPEMVTQSNVPMGEMQFDDMRTLDTSALVFALVNAVKELKAEIDAMKEAR